jgi:hypothetical protein
MSMVGKRRGRHEEGNSASKAIMGMEKAIVKGKSGERAQDEEGRKRRHT